MVNWSLLRFLWCMLWCLTSSSLRANFFWQLGHRQLKGFSPDSNETDGPEKGDDREEGWIVDGMTVKSNETEGKEVLEHYTGQSLV